MCLDDCVVKFNRYVVLTREARRLLMDYPWPGNYIQLRAFLERMVLTAPARTVNDGYVRSLLEELYPCLLYTSMAARDSRVRAASGEKPLPVPATMPLLSLIHI